MTELCQLYDNQGRALVGQGAVKDKIFSDGLLHGASHVWIWRQASNGIEILLQKRAANKRTWPNLYDVSAAGHIDLGEDPVEAAIRETHEEIGIQVHSTDLKFIGVQQFYIVAGNDAIENEYQWLYLLELSTATNFKLEQDKVAALEWKPIADFKQEVRSNTKLYVPHGTLYFDTVTNAIENPK